MQPLLKILMVEDSETDAGIIQRLLNKSMPAPTFKLCMTKKDFLVALEEFRPDIILADNSLPQFDATEAMTIVKQQMPHTPFILVTGTVSEEFAANITKLGADDYILKDRLARLPAAIETALKQRQFQKEKTAALKSLIESEEKYRTLVEQAFDGIVIYTQKGEIVSCSQSAANYTFLLVFKIKRPAP
jgi:PleD family two-component response regulator